MDTCMTAVLVGQAEQMFSQEHAFLNLTLRRAVQCHNQRRCWSNIEQNGLESVQVPLLDQYAFERPEGKLQRCCGVVQHAKAT